MKLGHEQSTGHLKKQNVFILIQRLFYLLWDQPSGINIAFQYTD